MNHVVLMGRLVRDPDTRQSSGENPISITRYTLAVERRVAKKEQGSNQQTTDFINCTSFGKAGDFAKKYFTKGMRVLIAGKLQTRSYTNKDGQKVNVTEVIVDEQEFADSKNNASGGNPQPRPADNSDEFVNATSNTDDSLPFD